MYDIGIDEIAISKRLEDLDGRSIIYEAFLVFSFIFDLVILALFFFCFYLFPSLEPFHN